MSSTNLPPTDSSVTGLQRKVAEAFGYPAICDGRLPGGLRASGPAGHRRAGRVLSRLRSATPGGDLAAALDRPRPAADVLPPARDHDRAAGAPQDAEEPEAA